MLQELFSTPIWNTDLSIDSKGLTDFAYYVEEETQSNNRSNVGGFQSEAYDPSLFRPCHPLVKGIVTEYGKFLNSLHVSYPVKLESMWININRKGDYNNSHTHIGNQVVWSGVYYAKVPKDSGGIVFHNPDPYARITYPRGCVSEYKPHNSIDWTFTPVEGRLFLFPAGMEHRVLPNNSEEDRISFAFNCSYVEKNPRT